MKIIKVAIFRYFEGVITYTEILEFVWVSLSDLKRWFRYKGMKRCPPGAIRNDMSDIFEAVRDELS